MATSSKHKGWLNDIANGRLGAVYNGTEVFDFDANDMVITPDTTVTGALTASTTLGVTGVATMSDELRVANGKNIRLGTISAFATTQPTNALVIKTGTAPVGAITTSVGLYTDGTTMKKIIADGTASDVQT